MSDFLILGATGKTGRRVTTGLADAGHTVRAAARTPGAAAPGVTPVRFDWHDPSTHEDALAGVDGVYLVPPAFSLDHPPLVRALVERAVAAGVQRIVFLSARGADIDDAIPLRQAELAVEASGADWTHLRPAWFAQNLTEGTLRPRDGVIAAPAGDAPSVFVDVQDIADVAVAALTKDGHTGLAYELSTPDALTWEQAAGTLSRESGVPVTYADADPETWVRAGVDAGAPEDYLRMLAFLFEQVRAGHEARVSYGVQQALGRPATSFAGWAAREAGALRDAEAPALR
jgi:uncharacterized protein YbjT (DUF2867 family)